jgi:hypothetical protein
VRVDGSLMTLGRPVYLVGTTGMPNYGDELIARLWLRSLAAIAPRTPVWLDCPNPGIAATLFAGDHPNLRCTDTLWRTAWQIGERSVEESLATAERFVTALGTPRSDVGLSLLSGIASMHLIGGGYINSMWSVNCLIPALAAASARQHGHRLFGTGLGVMPQTEHTAAILEYALGAFEFGQSRDASAAIVPGLSTGPDDALLAFHPRLRRSWPDQAAAAVPRFMLLVQGDMQESPETRSEVLEVALGEARRAGWDAGPLGVVEALPPDDFWLRDELEARGLDVVWYPFQSLWERGVPVQSGQYWVVTRFHFHLLLAGSGIRGTAVVIDDDYYLAKHASLSALGTGWRVVDRSGECLDAGSPEAAAAFPVRAARMAREKWSLAERIYHPGRLWHLRTRRRQRR